MNFEKQLAALIEQHLTRRTENTEESDLNPLLSMLGCRYVAEGRDGVKILFSPEIFLDEYESLIVPALIEALLSQARRPGGGAPENCMAILDGLLKNERWRACLKSTDTAMALAIMLVDLMDAVPYSAAGSTLRDSVLPPFYGMLNEWLRPTAPFDPNEPRDMFKHMFKLVRAMFGDHWCDIALSGPEEMEKPWEVPGIIRATRPEFLPGLLPDVVIPIAATLPPLDGP
jgi:hypothetical protein